jgi:hypothetical protein
MSRTRSTSAEIAAIDDMIYSVAYREKPCTVRAIFYRVASVGLVPKTDKAEGDTQSGYGMVQRRVLKMRRSGRLPYSWITDGSRYHLKPTSYGGLDDCLRFTAEAYRRQLWANQGMHMEIWVEKDAMRGVLYPETSKFDVPLMIARGFAGESFLWQTAEAINDEGVDSVIYLFGDHDPSGVVAWDHTQRKLREFVNDDIDLTFERIAVTEEQIEEYDLPTRPTKQSTHAKRFRGESVDVDAMDTNVVRGLVRDAIESYIDPHALRMTRIAERSEREVLLEIAGIVDEG